MHLTLYPSFPPSPLSLIQSLNSSLPYSYPSPCPFYLVIPPFLPPSLLSVPHCCSSLLLLLPTLPSTQALQDVAAQVVREHLVDQESQG